VEITGKPCPSWKARPLWKHFGANHFTLTENIRLNADQEELSRFQMSVGNGASNGGDEGFVILPEQCHVEGDLVTEVYSDLINGNVSAEALPEYLHGRCILAVLNSTCDEYNKRITHLLPGDLCTYKSTNKLIPDNATSELIDDMPMEVLESINPTGLPPHELNLKVGSVIIVMRNLNVRESLCNGTRLVVTRLGHRVIEAIHILGSLRGKKGQTFDLVGVDMSTQVFSHGQLYVALSRIRSIDGLRVRTEPPRAPLLNIVFKEVLQEELAMPGAMDILT
ncbi:DNA helicase PIF1, partial [Aphelenchoides avenae]